MGNFLFSGLEQLGVAHQVKRSKFVYLPEESSDSLDYKETPVNVAMSQFGGEYAYCSSLAEESESAFMDVVESDSLETGSANADSDSSEMELDKDDEMTTLSGLVSTMYIFCIIIIYGHNLKMLKKWHLIVGSSGLFIFPSICLFEVIYFPYTSLFFLC